MSNEEEVDETLEQYTDADYIAAARRHVVFTISKGSKLDRLLAVEFSGTGTMQVLSANDVRFDKDAEREALEQAAIVIHDEEADRHLTDCTWPIHTEEIKNRYRDLAKVVVSTFRENNEHR